MPDRIEPASPLPWSVFAYPENVRGLTDILDANDDLVTTATGDPDRDERNLRFASHAASLYHELIDIARTVVAVCDAGNVDHAQLACMEGSPLVDAARAVIAKAGYGTGQQSEGRP